MNNVDGDQESDGKEPRPKGDKEVPGRGKMSSAKGEKKDGEELEGLAELLPDLQKRKPDVAPVNDREGESDAKMPAENADDPSTSMLANKSRDMDDLSRLVLGGPDDSDDEDDDSKAQRHEYDPDEAAARRLSTQGNEHLDHYPDSDTALEDIGDHTADHSAAAEVPDKEFINSGQSVSTATQTHEMRMPMYLPGFKPATGCTNASDFIVRCFVARLRSGITVVKHGRSRWCKSRLRVLQIHPDGRSLSWKPAEGEPNSNKRPPKLDLSACQEVRHAWSPDPQNPMYTGTPILRQKCEAANAHKSFALIFKARTVDVTAVTADQCKVLMEGFSALCFRLQVANLAGRGGAGKRPMPEEDGVSTTASNTLTNKSVNRT